MESIETMFVAAALIVPWKRGDVITSGKGRTLDFLEL